MDVNFSLKILRKVWCHHNQFLWQKLVQTFFLWNASVTYFTFLLFVWILCFISKRAYAFWEKTNIKLNARNAVGTHWKHQNGHFIHIQAMRFISAFGVAWTEVTCMHTVFAQIIDLINDICRKLLPFQHHCINSNVPSTILRIIFLIVFLISNLFDHKFLFFNPIGDFHPNRRFLPFWPQHFEHWNDRGELELLQ